MAEEQEVRKEEEISGWNMRSRKALPVIGNAVLRAYFLVMVVIYPFYFRSGYQEIGKVKYEFFRNISVVTAVVMLLITGTVVMLRSPEISLVQHYKRLSVTDWFVYGYLFSLLLSYLGTAYKKEAILGADGWYMGFLTQLILVVVYFFFSRYLKWKNAYLAVMLAASGLVFGLGILNRYSVYPISMEGREPGFISTLGNINWFCGYWAVFCPLGVLLYWSCEKNWQRAVAGFFMTIGFLSGVTQGSSSACLVFVGLFVLLFYLSFREDRSMYRFLEICIVFLLSCQIARLLRHLPGLVFNYEDPLGNFLTDTGVTLYLGIAVGILWFAFHRFVKNGGGGICRFLWLRRTGLLLLSAGVAGYVLLLAGNTCLPGGIPGLSGRAFFTFNEKWANSRGGTWMSGLRAFQSQMPFQKLIGVGPDCFAEYLYSVPDLAERVYAQFGNARLTNAHNEWITLLVNQGILGTVFYAGIFLSAVVRFLKRAPEQPVLYLFAAGVLSYMIHNMVSFQQVLNAPFVFILLGIGESILGEKAVDKLEAIS